MSIISSRRKAIHRIHSCIIDGYESLLSRGVISCKEEDESKRFDNNPDRMMLKFENVLRLSWFPSVKGALKCCLQHPTFIRDRIPSKMQDVVSCDCDRFVWIKHVWVVVVVMVVGMSLNPIRFDRPFFILIIPLNPVRLRHLGKHPMFDECMQCKKGDVICMALMVNRSMERCTCMMKIS
jgi:hypothetical protein